MNKKKKGRKNVITKDNIPPRQIGPAVLRKTAEPFMYENMGSLIFTNGEHMLPKEKAHEMGLYGIEVKEDKRFCKITFDEYLMAMEEQGKLRTFVVEGEVKKDLSERLNVIDRAHKEKEEPCKDESIQSLWLGRKLENILIKNNILLWKDLEDRTAEDLLRLDEVYAWHIDSIKIQLEKHGRKLKDSVDE